MTREERIKEMEAKLLNAVKEVEDVRDNLNELKNTPEDKRIMVPDCVHLYNGKDILFNNDKQVILWHAGAYSVVAAAKQYFYKPHHLIPADKHNLEVGKIYYHSGKGLDHMENLEYYGIWDGESFIYATAFGTISKAVCNYSTIMQAVPVEG